MGRKVLSSTTVASFQASFSLQLDISTENRLGALREDVGCLGGVGCGNVWSGCITLEFLETELGFDFERESIHALTCSSML